LDGVEYETLTEATEAVGFGGATEDVIGTIGGAVRCGKELATGREVALLWDGATVGYRLDDGRVDDPINEEGE